jgi:adenosylcobinamide kinase / adenosylcobinamide-phosphate guanylyltransferase
MAAGCELILGGQKSGKSRRGEALAADWLARSAAHRAVLLATGQAHDEEMRERIARHRADRAARVPRLETLEEPLHIGKALRALDDPRTLVVVDCLTLWLTNHLMPDMQSPTPSDVSAQTDDLLSALRDMRGPVVLIGNEIGLGVIPLGREVRAFVDALGLVNQRVAAACDRVTLMAAGLPLVLKDVAR